MLFLFKCHIFVSKRCAKMAISKKNVPRYVILAQIILSCLKILLSLQAEIRILNYR